MSGGQYLTEAQKSALEATAASLATKGKGITACDESAGTIGKRFEHVGITNTKENRRLYRQMLFTSPDCEKYLCGAILDPETLTQKSDDGVMFPELLVERGIAPGVKPHLKVYTLPGTGGDTVMQGLDSLAERCKMYYSQGARFAKWRSPIAIDTKAGRPTDLAIRANMSDLARYALICQSEGLMPIVEPDVVMEGEHTLEESVLVNTKVLSELFVQLVDHGVYLPGCTLKSNIINPGKDCSTSYTLDEIAKANVAVLETTVPVAIKTANYLSGGQTLGQAAARLAAINRHNKRGPWNLSFSWSAALQLPLLNLCKGKGELQLDAMSEMYIEELKIASAASIGDWNGGKDGDHVGKRKRKLSP
jgi:fructose-bisphosphate aldolase class I